MTVRTSTVTVKVDRDRCAGHGVCVMHAPALFELDDQSQSTVVCATTADAASARRAEANCPERAVTVEELS